MRAFVAATVAVFLSTFPGRGAEVSLSEAEFLAPLQDDHPAVRALLRDLGRAQGEEIAAHALEAPDLSLDREAPSGGARQLDLTLGWRPPRPDRRRLSIAAGRAGVEASRAQLSLDRLRLIESARETFARWAVESAVVETLDRQALAIGELAERERRRAEVGEVSGLSAQRIALAAKRARGDLSRAQARRAAASAMARAWRPDLATDVVPELPLLPQPLAPIEGTHPRVAALTGELEQARLTERALGKVAELPAVVAGWQRQELGGDTFDGPLVGISWPLPFDRGRGKRVAARAHVEALEAELEMAQREVSGALSGASQAYVALRVAALAARDGVDDVPAIVNAATASFIAGETDVTDLLDTLRSSTEVEIDALSLYDEALAAHRRLVLALPVPSTSAATTADASLTQGDSR